MSDYALPSVSSEGISDMRLASVQQKAGVSVMKSSMEQVEVQASMLTQMMQNITNMQEMSLNPNVGGNINIRF